MFVPNCRRCPLSLNLTSFVLNVSKSCTLCLLAETQLDFLVKYDHVTSHEGIFVILSFIGYFAMNYYSGTICKTLKKRNIKTLPPLSLFSLLSLSHHFSPLNNLLELCY
ncbi:hypothetical protein Hanom_Chr17g01551491 [Helianthus anomalus]